MTRGKAVSRQLFVYAHAVDRVDSLTLQVAAGVYIEKTDGDPELGPFDGRWDWTLFVRAPDDQHVRDELARVMVRHDLRLGDYYGGRHGSEASVVGFTGRFEDGALVLRDPTGLELPGGWEALRDRLRLLPADHWHDLLIWRTWPAAEAIVDGRSFATTSLIRVLSDLASVYLDFVGPVLPRIAST